MVLLAIWNIILRVNALMFGYVFTHVANCNQICAVSCSKDSVAVDIILAWTSSKCKASMISSLFGTGVDFPRVDALLDVLFCWSREVRTLRVGDLRRAFYFNNKMYYENGI